MKAEKILIREAGGADAESLISLNRTYNAADHVSHDLHDVRRALQENPSERVFVADSGGELIGFASCQFYNSFCYQRPTIELTEIFVVEKMRRRGVGTQLVDTVLRLARTENVLEVNLRVSSKNETAIRFYRSCGLDNANHEVFRVRYS